VPNCLDKNIPIITQSIYGIFDQVEEGLLNPLLVGVNDNIIRYSKGQPNVCGNLAFYKTYRFLKKGFQLNGFLVKGLFTGKLEKGSDNIACPVCLFIDL